MPKAKTTEPLAVVKNAMAEAVANVKEQQDSLVSLTMAEFDKARKVAVESLDATAEAQHKNLDAAVSAAKAAIDGLDKVNAVGRDLVKDTMTAPVANLEKLIGARTALEAVTAQVELVQAGQKQAVDHANTLTKLVQEVAKEVLKPVQEQVAANLEQLGKVKTA